MPLQAHTNDSIRRIDYGNKDSDYANLLLEISEYNLPTPISIGKEGTLYSLYYKAAPREYFEQEDINVSIIFALKLDTSDGSISRKIYMDGNRTEFMQDEDIVLTGIFLDEPGKFTLYKHPTETTHAGKALAAPEGTIGYTYENGIRTRETKYTYQYKKGQ